MKLVSNDSMSDAMQQTITPYFTVQNADRLIDFLIATFGTNVVKQSRYDDHTLQHARLVIGNSLIMLNESTEDYPVNVSQMHVYVKNADTSYEVAMGLGAASMMKPNDRPHGDRMAGIKDPCGNVWWIASHLG